ncbi:MAG: hypothetical protein QOF31_3042, partial [Mycobacterium sp.]|nr:hypothetical protein [Mycobacterium sp.]
AEMISRPAWAKLHFTGAPPSAFGTAYGEYYVK